MNIFRRYKTLWMVGVIVVIAILFIVNFSHVVSGVKMVLNSVSSLVAGAALAFILNLIMDPVERAVKKYGPDWMKKKARGIGMLAAFLSTFLIITLMMAIVIPNLTSAITMLTKEVPRYFADIEKMIEQLFERFPELGALTSGTGIGAQSIDWKSVMDTIGKFLSKGTGVMNSTMNLVSSVVGSFVNLFIVIIFASYVLADKERFVRLYYTLTELYLPRTRRLHMTRNIRILNQSFKAFITGEIIEAMILTVMCLIGMLILRLPYAMMISILVGVINMIPMVGAFIGGGIGAFIIFTISPVKCLIFIIFLCVIQQIESNIFFPRIIGNKVGLPGIYVMMTIVIGGSLFGVMGMILGVPLMASLYKIIRNYIQERQMQKEEEAQEEAELKEKTKAVSAAAGS